MSNRSATDTIKGYFYQFDYSIEKLLSLLDDNDEITVEGVEDVDVETSTESTAIQCKYYAKTVYNHSVIAKPIRLMLSHYKSLKSDRKKQIKYHLYGYYKSGHEKLSLPIDILFLKQKFLTYTEKKVEKKHHQELGLTDQDLGEFLNLLSINIKAKEYSEQFESIVKLLKNFFSCDRFEAEFFFYNNALNEIRKIAIKNNESERRIKKKDFIRRINHKKILFNKWFLELKGRTDYFRTLKDQYFRSLNKAPFERFFLIDLPTDYSLSELKEVIFIISKRYSNLKEREPKTYCPYILFKNLPETELIEIKQQLFTEEFNFIDGYPFHGAEFSSKAISIEANYHNDVRMKILSQIVQVTDTLEYVSKTKEVYQFYFDEVISNITNANIKNVCIQIQSIDDIKEII